jgi:hypothetical protein
MLIKPATSGGEAPPEKNDPGCCGDDDELGKGRVVVVVVGSGGVGSGGGGGAAGFVSVGTAEAEVTGLSSPSNNRLERGKKEEDDMAGGQGDG